MEDAGYCERPSDPSRAALCLIIEPEEIQFEGERNLDGSGTLIVEVHDTPTPDNPNETSNATPIFRQIYPAEPDGGISREQTLVTKLPAFRLDNVPPTAYVRAIFADNFMTLARRPTWGTWLGGYDLSGGWIETPPIQAVQIPVGTGRTLRMPLVALRRLRATLTLASGVTPLDDAEGTAWVLAVRSANSPENEPLHDGTSTECVRIGSEFSTLEGVLVGSGTFYLAAAFDDYNVGGTVPPGGLVSFDFKGTVFSLPEATRVEVARTAYSVNATVPLSFLVPVGPGGAPQPFSCPRFPPGNDR